MKDTTSPLNVARILSLKANNGIPALGKKAQLMGLLFANPVVLTILAIVLGVLLITFVGVGIFLALNIFTTLGALLIIVVAIMVLKGMVGSTTWGLLSVGLLLIFLPIVSDSAGGITLAAVLP